MSTLPDDLKRSLLRFDSPAELASTMRRYGVAGRLRGWGDDRSWYGNETEAESFSRCATGDLKMVAKIDSEFAKYHRLQQLELQVRSWQPAPFGAYPIVGDFLAGSPDPMRRVEHVDVDTSAIRLVVNTTSSAGVSAEHLRKRGLVIAAFARALGAIRPLELHLLCAVDGRKDGATVIMSRLPTTPMNLSIVSWALSSSGFTRGLLYGLARAANSFSGGWAWSNYDHHAVTDRLREFIGLAPHDVYIPPINLTDAMLTNPYEWLDTMLDRYLPEKNHDR